MLFDFIEVKIKGNNIRPLIQVFIDRDGGVTIDDCAKITRQLTDTLDMTFPDVPQYRLEVSSPGIRRPLKSERDFQRHIGQIVNIQYVVNTQEQSVEGEIIKTDKNFVFVRFEEEIIKIPLKFIRVARIQLRW